MEEVEFIWDKKDETGRLLFRLSVAIFYEATYSNKKHKFQFPEYKFEVEQLIFCYATLRNDKITNAKNKLVQKVEELCLIQQQKGLKKIEIDKSNEEEIKVLLENWGQEIYYSKLFENLYLPDFILNSEKNEVDIDFIDSQNNAFSFIEQEMIIRYYIVERLKETSILLIKDSNLNDDKWLYNVLLLNKGILVVDKMLFILEEITLDSLKLDINDLLNETKTKEVIDFLTKNRNLDYQKVDFSEGDEKNNIVSIHQKDNNIIGFLKVN